MSSTVYSGRLTVSSPAIIKAIDTAVGYTASAVPDPLAAENLHSDHGRGIYLINQLMDEVSFERNGAEIRMRKAGSASEGATLKETATGD